MLFSIQNSGIGDINSHTKSKRHLEYLKSAESNRSKTIYETFHMKTSELNKLCAAEGTMVFHAVKHSHSYISQACTINLSKKCFPDSSIAKNITCNRTKASEIACNVLAPSITGSVVLELRGVSFFSVCYDASNKGNAKMLPIVVQFFSKFGVKYGILEFIEQQHESADALFNNIKYVIEANGLNLNQLVSIGSDNTNVNVANCYSHILHNSVKHGNEHLLFDIEGVLLKIYSHFGRSSVRSQELVKYFEFAEQEQKVILKHIRIRWLSPLQSIERLIAINPVIKSYFLNLGNNECPGLLLNFFTCNKGECSLYFLTNILPEVQAANLSLQREYTTGVNLHNIITNLIRKLNNRLRDDFFGYLDGLYNDFNNIKSKYIGSKEKYDGINKQIESFLSSNLGASKRAEARANDGDGQSLCDECEDEDTHDFDSDDDERDARCHKNQKENRPVRVDHLWAYLIDGEDVPNLKKLVQFAFSIPASNAFCETIFSHMKYLWNDNRNRMSHDLVGAELKIKMNTHFTCAQFYDYLLNESNLLKQIQSSDKYSHLAKVPRIAE
ncbi:unnamed protein product [Rotaria socialis]|uniref:HAT C-terminal dimerisation domain-containing protein n=1 Tax=Rotaria socialis TaxID=392032 RepID=A0A817WRV2_9BILA|nr:unnamed protein product [Rotaria socialis]